jgi:hypothetical protein
VCEQRFGVDVPFAAENFVAVDRELIKILPVSFRVLAANSGRIAFRYGILSDGTLK